MKLNFMKVFIPIKQDSWYTYPIGELEFIIGNEIVTIKIRGLEDEREISVDKNEFASLIQLLNIKNI